jgi:hypothetical protein
MCCEIIIIPSVLGGVAWIICLILWIYCYKKKTQLKIKASNLEFIYCNDTDIHLGKYNDVNNTNNTNTNNTNKQDDKLQINSNTIVV